MHRGQSWTGLGRSQPRQTYDGMRRDVPVAGFRRFWARTVQPRLLLRRVAPADLAARDDLHALHATGANHSASTSAGLRSGHRITSATAYLSARPTPSKKGSYAPLTHVLAAVTFFLACRCVASIFCLELTKRVHWRRPRHLHRPEKRRGPTRDARPL